MNRGAAILAVAVLALSATGVAFAGKGAGGSGGPKSSSSIRLVTVAADGAKVVGGAPAFGDQITYDVTTTATTEPYVETSCSQNGKLVYKQTQGFFAGFYGGSQMFTLGPTPNWQGGAASCTARLLAMVNGDARTLSTTTFDVTA